MSYPRAPCIIPTSRIQDGIKDKFEKELASHVLSSDREVFETSGYAKHSAGSATQDVFVGGSRQCTCDRTIAGHARTCLKTTANSYVQHGSTIAAAENPDVTIAGQSDRITAKAFVQAVNLVTSIMREADIEIYNNIAPKIPFPKDAIAWIIQRFTTLPGVAGKMSTYGPAPLVKMLVSARQITMDKYGASWKMAHDFGTTASGTAKWFEGCKATGEALFQRFRELVAEAYLQAEYLVPPRRMTLDEIGDRRAEGFARLQSRHPNALANLAYIGEKRLAAQNAQTENKGFLVCDEIVSVATTQNMLTTRADVAGSAAASNRQSPHDRVLFDKDGHRYNSIQPFPSYSGHPIQPLNSMYEIAEYVDVGPVVLSADWAQYADAAVLCENKREVITFKMAIENACCWDKKGGLIPAGKTGTHMFPCNDNNTAAPTFQNLLDAAPPQVQADYMELLETLKELLTKSGKGVKEILNAPVSKSAMLDLIRVGIPPPCIVRVEMKSAYTGYDMIAFSGNPVGFSENEGTGIITVGGDNERVITVSQYMAASVFDPNGIAKIEATRLSGRIYGHGGSLRGDLKPIDVDTWDPVGMDYGGGSALYFLLPLGSTRPRNLCLPSYTHVEHLFANNGNFDNTNGHMASGYLDEICKYADFTSQNRMVGVEGDVRFPMNWYARPAAVLRRDSKKEFNLLDEGDGFFTPEATLSPNAAQCRTRGDQFNELQQFVPFAYQ